MNNKFRDTPVFAYLVVATLSFVIVRLLGLGNSTDTVSLIFAGIIGDRYVKNIVDGADKETIDFPWYLYVRYVATVICINIISNALDILLDGNANIINLFLQNLVSAILLLGFGYWDSRKFRKTTSNQT